MKSNLVEQLDEKSSSWAIRWKVILVEQLDETSSSWTIRWKVIWL